MSRLAQSTKSADHGLMKAIKYLAGYLRSTSAFRIEGVRAQGTDLIEVAVDSDHHGDPRLTKQSQSGLMVNLNGVPMYWRSGVQPSSSVSPAQAEIYALSEGGRDARGIGWIAEELGMDIVWPMVIQVDSSAARSFQGDTCPKSRLRGCFN